MDKYYLLSLLEEVIDRNRPLVPALLIRQECKKSCKTSRLSNEILLKTKEFLDGKISVEKYQEFCGEVYYSLISSE